MHRRAITAAVVTGSTVALSAVAAVTGAGAASAQPSARAVAHTKPAWTAHAKHLGRAKSSAPVSARVYLAPRGGLDAVKQEAAAVSTPGSAQYHHFLTTAQYNQRFAPSATSVRTLSSYLRGAGLHVTKVGAGHRYVAVTGTVKAAEKAFGTTIEKYHHGGEDVQAPGKTVSLPGDLKADVLTVSGLDTTPHRTAPTSKQAAPPPAGFRNARPCSLYYGQVPATYQADYQTPLPKFRGETLSYAPCGYTGPQFRSAYERGATQDGAGVTVAITDAYAAPTIAKDANTYARNHGDGTYRAGQLIQSTPAAYNRQAKCGPSDWYGEETLDVEAVHAMAPGARIHYYASASCFDDDFLDTLARVVDDNDSQLVTNSWSDLEEVESADGVAAYEDIFLQGAVQGISFMYSSGDDGDELASSGLKQVDYPSSDPYVTAVGGTSTAIGASGKLAFQTGWGTNEFTLAPNGNKWTPAGYLYGAGGGSSALFNRPSYQDGATKEASRQVPDVAMDADPNTGILVGETQKFPNGTYYDEYRIGGTSLASPLFAGMTALSLQHAGGGVGLLNPSIYRAKKAFDDVQGTPPDAGVVRADYVNTVDGSDGVSYTVRTFNQDSSLKTNPGYDQVTGVGVPNPRWISALG